jgi:hypothetical protein
VLESFPEHGFVSIISVTLVLTTILGIRGAFVAPSWAGDGLVLTGPGAGLGRAVVARSWSYWSLIKRTSWAIVISKEIFCQH